MHELTILWRKGHVWFMASTASRVKRLGQLGLVPKNMFWTPRPFHPVTLSSLFIFAPGVLLTIHCPSWGARCLARSGTVLWSNCWQETCHCLPQMFFLCKTGVTTLLTSPPSRLTHAHAHTHTQCTSYSGHFAQNSSRGTDVIINRDKESLLWQLYKQLCHPECGRQMTGCFLVMIWTVIFVHVQAHRDIFLLRSRYFRKVAYNQR